MPGNYVRKKYEEIKAEIEQMIKGVKYQASPPENKMVSENPELDVDKPKRKKK